MLSEDEKQEFSALNKLNNFSGGDLPDQVLSLISSKNVSDRVRISIISLTKKFKNTGTKNELVKVLNSDEVFYTLNNKKFSSWIEAAVSLSFAENIEVSDIKLLENLLLKYEDKYNAETGISLVSKEEVLECGNDLMMIKLYYEENISKIQNSLKKIKAKVF